MSRLEKPCRAEKFITDFSDLCNECPLREYIPKAIQKQVIDFARIQQQILTTSDFAEYISQEIVSAREAMQTLHNMEIQNQDHEGKFSGPRANRIEGFIWNSERIKALNALRGNVENTVALNDNRSTSTILDYMNSIDGTGWKYAFQDEGSFRTFVNLLSAFFDREEYTIPNESIRLKPRTGTRVARVLRDIHRDLSVTANLKSDVDYLKIVRVLSPFSEFGDERIYKTLTR